MAGSISNQVFVRNLPIIMADADVDRLFGEHGPIKRIDIIKSTEEDGTKVSRGFGFVKFALAEDAARAVSAINGKVVGGRRLNVEIALKKGAKRERGSAEAAAAKGARGSDLQEPPQDEGETANDLKGQHAPVAQGEEKPAKAERGRRGGHKAVNGKEQVTEAVRGEGEGVKEGAAVKGQSASHKSERKTKVKCQSKGKPGVGAEDAVEESTEEADKSKESVAEEQKEKEEEEPCHPGIRSVMVFGIAEDLTKKKLLKRLKKACTIESVELSENTHGYLPKGNTAMVVCASRSGPKKLIAKLDGHTIHGSCLRLRRKVEVAKDESVHQRKKLRLVVRNLAWEAREKDLADIFLQFGPLAEVHIPKVEVTFMRKNRETGQEEQHSKSKGRGFAFVQFLCMTDALRVVKDHGMVTICGREAAVDFAIAKKKFDEIQAGTKAVGEEHEEEHEEEQEKEESKAAFLGRSTDDEGTGEVDASDSEDEGTGSEEGQEGGEEEEEEGSEEVDSEDEEEDEDEEKQPSDVSKGCTVFVRNVPFDASEDSLLELFREYGRIKHALMVKDRATGLPKGTAFVKFFHPNEALRCLAAAAGISQEGLSQRSGSNPNPHLFIGGRALSVARAIEKAEAERKSLSASGKRQGARDKRNIYLANEGSLLIETEEAAKDTPKADMDRRSAARAEKKQKLKNPLFFISQTRLSIRNLHSLITHNLLATAAPWPSRAFKPAIVCPSVSPKDVKVSLQAQDVDPTELTPAKLQIPKVAPKSIVKVQVVKDMDAKPTLGAGVDQENPSKGFAFVTFSHHAHALAALRKLNNNPAFTQFAQGSRLQQGEKPRLIVEFSVENHAKIKLQEERKAKFEKKKGDLLKLGLGQDGKPLGPAGVSKQKKLSRGQKQREKKRREKEAREAAGEGSETVADAQGAPAATGKTAAAAAAGKGGKRKRSTDSAHDGEGGGTQKAATKGAGAAHRASTAPGTEPGEGQKRKQKRKVSKKKKAAIHEEQAATNAEKSYVSKKRGAAASKGAEAAEGAVRNVKKQRWYE
ncbi:unnamed protein product [Chrysoparadoxa australica]